MIPQLHLLNWGMGVENTASLVRWMLEPQFRPFNDFHNLIVLTAAIESADLDEAQENKLERKFAREYHLITRDERLDEIAQDIVSHFLRRGYQGKAMVVSIDRFTLSKCTKNGWS